MKHYRTWIYTALLFICCRGTLSAQTRSFCDGYDDYSPFGYQHSYNWETIRKVYFERYETAAHFHEELEKKPAEIYMMCPWWVEDLYRQDSLVAQKADCIGYIGYVINVWSGRQNLVNEWNGTRGNCVLDLPAFKNKSFELVVFNRKGEAFDYFLCSPSARQNFYVRLLHSDYGALRQTHNGKKADGLNIYLPDFTFKEKRAFTQFIKSLSMLLNHYGKDGKLYYDQKPVFSLTFSRKALHEQSFLATLTRYVDFIHFIDFDEYGFPAGEQETIDSAFQTSFVMDFISQLYIIRENRPYTIKKTTVYPDIRMLSQANYASNNWELYFTLEVLLLCLVFGLILAYNLSSSLYIFSTRYPSLTVPVIVTLATEIIILFVYMVESASGTTVFFRMETVPWYTLLLIPLLPLLILFLYGAFKIYFGEKVQP